MLERKNGQVWIETVLYTLVGLILIGLVLAYAIPKITSSQERLAVEQTVAAMKTLDKTITSIVELGSGNVRSYDLTFKKGEFYINGTGDSILFVLRDMKKEYSQPEFPVEDGRIEILTRQERDKYSVYLKLDYNNYANITYIEKDVSQKFSQAPTPYRFKISNLGSNQSLSVIDFKQS